ncbi:aspartate-semialdehyde dehydrogenase [soil metagenome]
MVGQHFVTLLENHPWFELQVLAASPRSAGKSYAEAVDGRWAMQQPLSDAVGSMQVLAVQEDAQKIAEQVQMVFCALDLDKESIRAIEDTYASLGVAVVSNNSANRWADDVPMIIPEVNPEHLKLIDVQRKSRGWDTGLIVVKPNCSIQSYVLALTALKQFQPTEVAVTSLQAISGAGKTFERWPEMVDNVVPYIEGEEEKSVTEPLKIWGELVDEQIEKAPSPQISATCIRVPVSDGHMASVSVNFANKPSRDDIIEALKSFQPEVYQHNLPSQPAQLFHIFEEPDRPQTKLDRDNERGMGISIGRLRPDAFFDWDFIALSHNTLRGAAGGAVLTAELLVATNYVG